MRGKAVELDQAALADAPLDAYGIPQSVRHAPQTALGVWQYVHQLEAPIADPRRAGNPYTHICLLCADELLRAHALVSPSAWTKALMRQRMSTNAAKHLERRHPDVRCEPRRKAAEGKPKRVKGGSGGAGTDADTSAITGVSTPSASPAGASASPPPKRARTTKKALTREAGDANASGLDAIDRSPASFQSPAPTVGVTPPRSSARPSQGAAPRSSPEQILFLLHRWLISSGEDAALHH